MNSSGHLKKRSFLLHSERKEAQITFDAEDAVLQLRRLGLVRVSFVAGYGETFIANSPAQALKGIKAHWGKLLEGSVRTAANRSQKSGKQDEKR